MGRGITQDMSLSELTSVISSEMAKMETDSAIMISNSDSTVQIISNSTNCKNKKITRSGNTYVSYGTVYQSTVAVQSLYAQIVNELTSNQDSTTNGLGLGPATDQNISATINNLLATTLTQSSITTYMASVSNNTQSIQICQGSQGGENYIFGSYNDVYNFYYDSYSQMKEVQKVSADIKNTLDASQSAKKVGLLSMLARMITVICVIIIIVVAVVVVILVFGMVG